MREQDNPIKILASALMRLCAKEVMRFLYVEDVWDS